MASPDPPGVVLVTQLSCWKSKGITGTQNWRLSWCQQHSLCGVLFEDVNEVILSELRSGSLQEKIEKDPAVGDILKWIDLSHCFALFCMFTLR